MVVDFADESDLYIINTCAVTAESERKSAQMIRRALKSGGRVAVIGCYSQLDTALGGIKGVDFIGGSKDKSAVFREANRLLNGNDRQLLIDTDLTGYEYERLSIGTEKTDIFSSTRAFVKIQDGCNGRCSYCIIPKTRGKVRSRAIDDIMSEVSRLAVLGYKEIVLTGIETSAYDFAPLFELVRRIDRINGIKRLRFGSLSPNAITEEFLLTARDTDCFMLHMHLSVQSGSDRILRLMRRPYNKGQLCKKIEEIYRIMPQTLISADMIVGFPTETEEDFLETLDLVSDFRLSHIHAFPFSPRPGTNAAEMDGRVPAGEVKKRNERLIKHSSDVKNSIMESKKGTRAAVLIEQIRNNICTGHTEDFLEAKIKSHNKHNVGDIIMVDITSHENGYLLGEQA
jgi:threonylcarbamoyladenosine tRNA methylthiotransferase MtaB